jgi:hypothetical protein
MADIFIDVGAMTTSNDTTKVAVKYAPNAPKLMREGAVSAIGKGFTTEKGNNKEGYSFNAELTAITFGTVQDRPSVKCTVAGVINILPGPLLHRKVSGNTAIGVGGSSVTDRDVADCIQLALKDIVVKEVLPAVKDHHAKKPPPSARPRTP